MQTEPKKKPFGEEGLEDIYNTNSAHGRTISNKINKLNKFDTIYSHFAQGGTLHRFQAEPLGDHCLPSTISDLQKYRGVEFSREWVDVPNRFGSTTRVMSYWLEYENRIKAQKYFGLAVAI